MHGNASRFWMTGVENCVSRNPRRAKAAAAALASRSSTRTDAVAVEEVDGKLRRTCFEAPPFSVQGGVQGSPVGVAVAVARSAAEDAHNGLSSHVADLLVRQHQVVGPPERVHEVQNWSRALGLEGDAPEAPEEEPPCSAAGDVGLHPDVPVVAPALGGRGRITVHDLLQGVERRREVMLEEGGRVGFLLNHGPGGRGCVAGHKLGIAAGAEADYRENLGGERQQGAVPQVFHQDHHLVQVVAERPAELCEELRLQRAPRPNATPPERASALPARPQRLRTPRLPSVPSVALLNCLSIAMPVKGVC
eukprot:CAMPEP_0175192404 /NCGR_PEP_ID=MMETSP0093-20121207/5435_1 /TAXON_ID=311494 /ORGANISM="Alexandrium monilatum, Strain CCMP3105" /LENGTH=305 /DNA_ID=CAMNT_0016485247 /DNA_START=59 /DNA_END=973 /DNA_ORIENTATION=-